MAKRETAASYSLGICLDAVGDSGGVLTPVHAVLQRVVRVQPRPDNLDRDAHPAIAVVKTISLIALALACAGCIAQSVPRTKITGSIGGKPVSFEMPKDVTLGSLSFQADTNGNVSVVVSNLTTRMNPEIVVTTGEAQDKMIRALGDKIIDGIKSARP